MRRGTGHFLSSGVKNESLLERTMRGGRGTMRDMSSGKHPFSSLFVYCFIN